MLVADGNPVALAGLVSRMRHCGLDAEGALAAESAAEHIGSSLTEGRPFRCVLAADTLLFDAASGQCLLPLAPLKAAGTALIRCLPAGFRGEARPIDGVGPVSFLHKPIRRAALRQALQEAFGEVVSAPSAAPEAPRRPPAYVTRTPAAPVTTCKCSTVSPPAPRRRRQPPSPPPLKDFI